MSHKVKLPSPEYLHRLLRYSPDDGKCFRRIDKAMTRAGDVVGSKTQHGYLCVKIDGQLYQLHRIIWVLSGNEDPKDMEIDHKNGIRDDNRISNLRCVSKKTNQRNRRRHKDSLSGVANVQWMERNKKYRVLICGKHYGLFKTLEGAIEKRDSVFKENGFGEVHGRLSS